MKLIQAPVHSWALAKAEDEEKPTVHTSSRSSSLPSSVSKLPATISPATPWHLPCPNTYCSSHQIHWACALLCKYPGAQCELVMPMSLPLFFIPSKGLEAFGEAESVLHILCLQPSLHSAAVWKVAIDGPAEMGIERLLLTEAQLALRLLALPSSFLRLLQIRVVK